ncbi:MAG: dethiobiotin synthase [Pirellulales bacterium]
MARGLFIAGTDTNVGKTYVAAAIARSLRDAGVAVGVYKPAASGCRWVEGRLVSDDATTLWNAAGRPESLEAVCPQVFAAPLAPHLAARAEGRELDWDRMRDGVRFWESRCEVLLVEGAGGYLSPLGDDAYVADLAMECAFPLVLVAPNVLGAINQTLQTVFVVRHYRGGLPIAGIVVNDPRLPAEPDPSRNSNVAEIARRAGVPIVTTLAHGGGGFSPPVEWV